MNFAPLRLAIVLVAVVGLVAAQKPATPQAPAPPRAAAPTQAPVSVTSAPLNLPPPAGVFSPADVKTVYLLPMGNGLDQFLATHLVQKGFYRVVADPSKADAILTDRIGSALETKLNELYPKPGADTDTKVDVDTSNMTPDEAEAARAEATRKSTERAMDKARSDWLASRSTIGRGKGNLYLIDRYNRNVLWSIYERPKSTLPDVLDHTAMHIVSELEKQVRPRK